MKRPLWIRGVGSANFSASPSAIAPTSSGMKSSRSRSRSLRETVSRTGLWTDSPIGNRTGARVHPATVGVRNNGRADPGLLAHGRPLPDLKQGRRLSLMRARPTRGRRNDTFDGQGGRPRHPATADSRYLLARQLSADAGRAARAAQDCGVGGAPRPVWGCAVLAIALRRISCRCRHAATDTCPCSPGRWRPIPARVRQVRQGWRA